MAHSVNADSDYKNEEEDYSQEEEQSDDDKEMSEPAAASAKVIPGISNDNATENTKQQWPVKKPNVVKTKKDRYNDAMKHRKLMKGKPIEKWNCAALKAECLYKKQKGDAGVPEKKAELLAMCKIRSLRPSPPCSDAEEENEIDEKVEGYSIKPPKNRVDATNSMAPTTSKNPLPEASVSIKATATSDLKLPASSNVAGPPVKRGRGRPRKNPLPEAGISTPVRGLPTPTGATLVSPSPSVGTKRGRLEDQEETARRVARRTNEKDAEDAFIQAPTMDELVLTGLQSDDEDVLQETLMDINTLLYDKVNGKAVEEAQNDFFQLGGHLVVVRVMQNHLGSVKIQQWGTPVLTNACSQKNSIKQAVGRVGGMEAILGAMEKHRKNQVTVHRAIGSLINLSTLEANAELLVTKTDGVSLVLKCMKKFSDDDEIVHEACNLFRSLCVHEQLRSKLDDANVGTALMVAYDKNKDNARIREKAKAAITLMFE